MKYDSTHGRFKHEVTAESRLVACKQALAWCYHCVGGHSKFVRILAIVHRWRIRFCHHWSTSSMCKTWCCKCIRITTWSP